MAKKVSWSTLWKPSHRPKRSDSARRSWDAALPAGAVPRAPGPHQVPDRARTHQTRADHDVLHLSLFENYY
ncbi:MAG: hypothetical protein VW644_12865, partial [Alphaproteobacteria bacterium]